MFDLPSWLLAAALACATSITLVAILHRYDFSVEGTPLGSVKLSPGEVEKAD